MCFVYFLLAALLCSTTLAKSFQSNYYKDCGAGPNYQLRSKRIASGRNAVPNSWPSMVKLVFTSPTQPDEDSIESSMCGGTLLDHYHILTASHCINKTNGVPFIDAYLGAHDGDAEEGFVKRRVVRYWRYNYDPKNKGDSGGPMLYQRSKGTPWIQIGIMSYKSQVMNELEDPEEFSYGGIVTRVANYLDVIREEIRNLEKKSRG